ncbi:transglutaminase-like cysteine peptidase [Roseibium marinum]|uniref:Transglutaminase-like cysteine proteinase BTLCP n=1 Tax=Roseibium marinum TaxID=281252 RepID=A0A2S3UVB0_9HYPH|nr:transglutaminase-like cysteine peptidase [Roseibium marinum]POF31661.1 transglutaminase-like cysteine proteinase BTLCP [Roseibium marinum]
MEHRATAPAVPAANGKAARKFGWALTCAFVLQAAFVTAQAEDGPFAPVDMTGISNVHDFIKVSLLETVSADALPVKLHFAPLPAAKAVELRTIRVGPLAKPDIQGPPLGKTARQTIDLPAADTAELKPTLLFGTLGKPVALSPVTKRWTRALGEFRADGQGPSAGRNGFRAYTAILDDVKDKRRGLQIPKVNYMVNRVLAYRDDARLWQTGEYWASPVESLTRRAGDCEDYAILKYALLRDLGVEDQDMRIVVLRDTAARQHHAVLSVRHEGKWLILDNRFSRVRFERDLPHYQVLYSVNAAGQWSHVPTPGSPVRLASRLKSATK